MITAALLLITSFFFFLKLIILIACSLKDSQKFLMQTFSYFCCRKISRIIFTSINLLYYSLKVCINDKWCLKRFLILIKFQYFSVFRRHKCITKNFIFTYLFVGFKVMFCSKGMKTIQTTKVTLMFRRYSS